MANKIIKKEDCPYCTDGEILFKKKQNEFFFECNKCPLGAWGFKTLEEAESQLKTFSQIKKKKKK